MNELRIEFVTGNMTISVQPVSGESAAMHIAGRPFAVDRIGAAPAVNGTETGDIDLARHGTGRLIIALFPDKNPSFDVVDPSSIRFFIGLPAVLPPGIGTADRAGNVIAARHRVVRNKKRSRFSGEGLPQIPRGRRTDKHGFGRVNVVRVPVNVVFPA